MLNKKMQDIEVYFKNKCYNSLIFSDFKEENKII